MRDHDEILIWFDKFLRDRTSATFSLETLCGGKTAVVEQHNGSARPLDDQMVAKIGDSAAALSYRYVSIKIDGCILSYARNWYRQDVLSESMKVALSQSNIPFGRIVAPLRFRRVSLSSEFFWQTWYEKENRSEPILRHQAFLKLSSGQPFCYLEENYLSNLRPIIVEQAFKYHPR